MRPNGITYQIKAARFPAYKDLAGFDLASSEVNAALVRQLHRGEFIDGADNVVLIAGPGTGKTHMATALGIQAVEHHRRKARFFSTVDLVNMLEQEKAMNKAGQLRCTQNKKGKITSLTHHPQRGKHTSNRVNSQRKSTD